MPNLIDAGGMLSQLQDKTRKLRDRYKDDPVGLAERLGLILPEKPLIKMQRLGLYDPERHGPILPGLRDLVVEVCSGEVEDAVVVGPRGGGKFLWVETPIPTPDGWKLQGELRKGDQVFDERGQVCKVVAAHQVSNNRDCYRVCFDDGSSVIASGDHLWQVHSKLYRRALKDRERKPKVPQRINGGWQGVNTRPQARPKCFPEVLTTDQIRSKLRFKDGEVNYSIPNASALECEFTDLALDPYLLGYWLGDGDTAGGAFTVGEEDADEFEKVLVDLGEEYRRWKPAGRTANRFRVYGLTAKLASMGLVGHKHIPVQYQRASMQQRLELMRGLMDSDGYCRGVSNNCVFGVKLAELADDFYELAVGLGWKARKKHKVGYFNGVTFDAYLVNFNPSIVPFRLRRKVDLVDLTKRQGSRRSQRFIVNIVPVPTVPVRCITVDSPNSLYLCGEAMIPTHNSKGVSYIEFFLWWVRFFDALNLGGSELQAAQVYSYLEDYLTRDPEFKEFVKGEPLQSKTESRKGNWIRVLTASQKSTRSPHAGSTNPDRGGLLVIDEEAEADPEIVASALPTINTARPSVSVRSSTFHNAVGSFAEVVDNHEEMGYKLYKWDVFDICQQCDCVESCQSSEPCFRDDHHETTVNPDTGAEETKLVHRAYCGGRAMYASGWMPMAEIEKLWRRSRRNHSFFEVEAMGSRPTTSGYVIKDQERYAQLVTSDSPESLYLPGCPVWIGVDWGAVNCGITVWQYHPHTDKHVRLEAVQIQEQSDTFIVNQVLMYAHRYSGELEGIRGDIGGGGSYFNPKLRNKYGLPVEDINFAEDKEAAAVVWNILNDAGLCTYPSAHEIANEQAKKWKRGKDGKIKKGNDHLCDATICYFSRLIDELGVKRQRFAPQTFSASMRDPLERTIMEPAVQGKHTHGGRVPVVVALGGPRRRM